MKLLHKLEGPTNSKPLQKPIGGAHILHDTLLESRPISHIPKQEGMEISFSQEDPIIGWLTIHIEEDDGNIVVTSRAHLVPHAEERGAHDPTRGFLVTLQEVPQDLTCGR